MRDGGREGEKRKMERREAKKEKRKESGGRERAEKGSKTFLSP